ncbi:hypothetical protein [Bacillus sp. Marseille-P3661]|uniref:hypothetical protein n=1 Tax=Bacillus sp. Marseille-P3661 TaxID=1936234 RepID=UPI000C843EE7|nr:hypothetical protein [Bacillus sp. Marseille-P3661]
MTRGRKKQYQHLEEEWIRLYNDEGLNFSEIAEQYNVQVETISKYIKDKVSKSSKSPFKGIVDGWMNEYRLEGRSFAEIARKYGVSESTVRTNINKELNPIINDLKWTWISLYKKGHSLNSIAEIYNLHPKIILKTINPELNIADQNQRNTYEHLQKIWIEQYESGLSFESIAKKYHVSSNTVYKNISEKVKLRRKQTKTDRIKVMIPTWRRLYQEKGHTLQEIAQQFDVAPSTIFKYIKEHK